MAVTVIRMTMYGVKTAVPSLTRDMHLPVKQLRFGDAGDNTNKGYHTLGKLKCYGAA